MDAVDELREALEAVQALPVLFVGSGISRRYLGSPDWDGLLNEFALRTGKPSSFYLGRVNGDRPRMATAIAENFYELWYDDPAYSDSRALFETEVSHLSHPFKYEVAKFIGSHDRLDDDSLGEELSTLSRVHLHAVITTNWDTLLEECFKDLEVFVGQQDVLFATTQAVGEIYKIHGSVTDPKSLVVTGEDYEEYWDRNPYLIAKLLTMLVEHPVLFLGYGLGDAHINKMLGNLIACLTVDQLEVLNDRLIFVRRPEPGETGSLRRGSLTVGPHTLAIREYVCADFLEMFKMLGDLPERFPARMLRRLRQSVYELTYSTEPSGRVHVLPMDSDEVDLAEMVVGVGMMERLGEKGYKALGRVDVIRDMLECATDHNTKRLTAELLPRLLRSAKFVPVFYPLYLAGLTDENGQATDTALLPANGRALVNGNTTLKPYFYHEMEKRSQQHFRELASEGDDQTTIEYGLVCQYDLDDVVALREFLRGRVPDADTVGTPFAKLCCKYDNLVFGPGFAGDRSELHSALDIQKREAVNRAV